MARWVADHWLISIQVAALWGLFYWGEAEHASPRALAYIGAMLCLYGAAIVLIARSSAA